jgi:hypothetical protein
MARRKINVDDVVRVEKLGVLGRVQEILEEAYYQVREEHANNADLDDNLDWMDAKIEAALEALKSAIEEPLSEIVDEVQDAG